MENINQLRFVSNKNQTTAQSSFFFEQENKEEINCEDVDEKLKLRRKPKMVKKNEKTVKFQGKKCTKRDIEDLFDRNEKEKPRQHPPDDCCYQECGGCVYSDIVMYEDFKEVIESLLL